VNLSNAKSLIAGCLLPLALLAGCGGGSGETNSETSASQDQIKTLTPEWAWAPQESAEREQTKIFGGSASAAPWVVNVAGGACSGVAINESWIVTAAHCPQSGSTITFRDGKKVSVDKVLASPTADVQLQRLSKPYVLSAYPDVDLDFVPPSGYPSWSYVRVPGEPAQFTPTPGPAGTIFGIGQPNSGEFREANVSAIGTTTDAVGGPAILVEGKDGSAMPGDSGGPLLVNGKLVGITSQGITSTAYNIHGRAHYANLAGSKELIKSVMVGAPVFQNGTAQIEVGREYLSRQLVFWKNGAWAGMVFFGNPYVSTTTTNSGAIVSLPAQIGDYISAGLVYTPAPATPQVEVRISSGMMGAIKGVNLRTARPQVEMATWLFQSNQRVMFVVNGNYVGETYASGAYYTPGWWSANGVTLEMPVALNNGDVLEVWVVPGVPGNAPPTSSTKILSKSLYWKST
jgi:trypsin